MQVPDQRAGSRSMDRSHKTGAPLDARRAGLAMHGQPWAAPAVERYFSGVAALLAADAANNALYRCILCGE